MCAIATILSKFIEITKLRHPKFQSKGLTLYFGIQSKDPDSKQIRGNTFPSRSTDGPIRIVDCCRCSSLSLTGCYKKSIPTRQWLEMTSDILVQYYNLTPIDDLQCPPKYSLIFSTNSSNFTLLVGWVFLLVITQI